AIARALRAVDPIAVADSVCCEGAIAETVAAMLVAAARDRAESPALKRALASVAEEELAHAGLAWRYLAWSVQRHGAAVREVLLRRFAEAERHVGVGPVPLAAPAMREALERHGHLTREERRRIARHVLAEVVAPAASSLLSLA
ncbi:MAG: ferritin-like domain-containing protein, partial [Myxococcales bacterium]|nr:ferritin-like domain-containing protein [Myxococcales bacterium]